DLAERPRRTFGIYVDPVSLKILGTTEIVRRGPIMTVFTDIHEFMMMPPHIGLRFVGWMGVAMVLMGISGLVIWWPREGQWLAAFLIRRDARGLRLHLDLHHAIGIWGLPLFIFLGFSGLYLTFPETFATTVRSVFPRTTEIKADTRHLEARWPQNIDQAI